MNIRSFYLHVLTNICSLSLVAILNRFSMIMQDFWHGLALVSNEINCSYEFFALLKQMLLCYFCSDPAVLLLPSRALSLLSTDNTARHNWPFGEISRSGNRL